MEGMEGMEGIEGIEEVRDKDRLNIRNMINPFLRYLGPNDLAPNDIRIFGSNKVNAPMAVRNADSSTNNETGSINKETTKKKRARTHYRDPYNLMKMQLAKELVQFKMQNKEKANIMQVSKLLSIPYNTLRDNCINDNIKEQPIKEQPSEDSNSNSKRSKTTASKEPVEAGGEAVEGGGRIKEKVVDHNH